VQKLKLTNLYTQHSNKNKNTKIEINKSVYINIQNKYLNKNMYLY